MATIVLDASWSADSDGGSKFPNDGSDWCGPTISNAYRTAFKFDISSLPSDATVTQVDFSVNVQAVTAGIGTMVWDIGPYNGDGQANSETDAAATFFTRCNVSADLYVNDTTQFRTTGVKTFANLGAQAIADVAAARTAGTIFSLASRVGNEAVGTDRYTELSEYTNGTPANRPRLTITYTPAGAGQPAVKRMGGIPFMARNRGIW